MRFFVFVCVFFFKFTFAQKTETFKVLDFNSNQPIENVRITLNNKDLSYSDNEGNFTIKTNVEIDSINLIHLNYDVLTLKITALKGHNIYLYPKSEILNKVELKSNKKYNATKALLGGLNVKGKRHLVWNSKAVTFIPYEKEGEITTLKYRLIDFAGVKGLKYLEFKVNLYLIDTITRLPKKQLISEDIITSNTNGDRIFSLDIRKHNIKMPKEGLFIAFIILDSSEYPTTSIMSRVGQICATPVIRTKVRKNKEKRFSLVYSKEYYDGEIEFKWKKIDDYFFLMDLELEK